MIHLSDEQMIHIGMLQDNELDLVVGGFLGTLIKNTKMRADEVPTEHISLSFGKIEFKNLPQ
jgi:hypothetical protein